MQPISVTAFCKVADCVTNFGDRFCSVNKIGSRLMGFRGGFRGGYRSGFAADRFWWPNF